jgi:hypothetical protein
MAGEMVKGSIYLIYLLWENSVLKFGTWMEEEITLALLAGTIFKPILCDFLFSSVKTYKALNAGLNDEFRITTITAFSSSSIGFDPSLSYVGYMEGTKR